MTTPETAPRSTGAEPMDGASAASDAAETRTAAVLEFERRHWGVAGGRKESRIRAEFGWSPARYYQVLNALLDTAAALRYDPVLVGRLREVRTERAEVRRTRRPGAAGAA